MPAIVEFPQVVREAMDKFGDLFSCEPQRQHFAEYLTGLMVAANKTITGINGEFVDTTDQSCLNRFLTAAQWSEQALNERRLELLQRDPTTRYSEQGVIALDDTLIDQVKKGQKEGKGVRTIYVRRHPFAGVRGAGSSSPVSIADRGGPSTGCHRRAGPSRYCGGWRPVPPPHAPDFTPPLPPPHQRGPSTAATVSSRAAR